MMVKSIPIERILHPNESWQVAWAIQEIEVYCDVLDAINERIAALDDPCGTDATPLRNAEAVVSSYALEIGMKSLWALDHPDGKVEKTHCLLKSYDELSPGTVNRLDALDLPRSALEEYPKPFFANRYSMEPDNRVFWVYPPVLLRQIVGLLGEKLEEVRKAELTSGDGHIIVAE